MKLIAQGNALHLPLAPASVQCVVTSPPYWGLRSYATGENKAHELGSEPLHDCLGWAKGENCGACYVCHMRQVFAEVWRVLRDDGVCFLNLGDSYANPGNNRNGEGEVRNVRTERFHGGKAHFEQRRAVGIFDGLKPKDLCGIPWRVALALQADGWYLRSDIIWAKPNPMPESVTDRPTKAHEYVFLLAKSQRYYWDQEAVRENYTRLWDENNIGENNGWVTGEKEGQVLGRATMPNCGLANSLPGNGRNLRTVWNIATAPYSGAHFATFPPALAEKCILAGTSARGACPKCGRAWARVVDKTPPGKHESEYQTIASGRGNGGDKSKHAEPSTTVTLGWQPACTCNAGDPVPCIVLDPFSGSGTTGRVAIQHGRRYVGIELSHEYIGLSLERTGNVQIGMGV